MWNWDLRKKVCSGNKIFNLSFVFLLNIFITPFLYAVDTKTDSKVAYINHKNIVLEEDEKITKFITPQVLLDHGRFQIRIKRPKKSVPAKDEMKVPTLTERIEARRIMHDANQAYFKGEISKTWELVEKAEILDPKFFRVKTMKGSLLYKIGSVDLAKEVWLESLVENPNQPEIVKVINELEAKSNKKAPASGKKVLPADRKVLVK